MGASDFVYVKAEKIKAVTDKAVLATIDGEDHWIPLSQLGDPERYRQGDTEITLDLTPWMAKKLGFGD